MKLFRALLCVAAGLWIATEAKAQETTGTFTGTVTDQTGAVLPGVTVALKNVQTGFTASFVTGGSGAYTAPILPVGTYDVEFSLNGFQTSAVRGLNLHVNDRLAVNASIAASGVSESIEVIASGELIQPTSAVQALMGAKQVQELPLNNRNFVQLATLAPGVSSDLADEVGVGLTSTMSMSINGARRNAVNWLVDGVTNVDVGSTSRCCRRRRWNRSRSSRSSPAATRPSGRAAAAASSTSSPSRRHERVLRQRLRVLPQRRAERELVLPQAEHRSGIRDTRRRSSTTTSATPSAARDSQGEAVLLLLAGVAPHQARADRR